MLQLILKTRSPAGINSFVLLFQVDLCAMHRQQVEALFLLYDASLGGSACSAQRFSHGKHMFGLLVYCLAESDTCNLFPEVTILLLRQWIRRPESRHSEIRSKEEQMDHCHVMCGDALKLQWHDQTCLVIIPSPSSQCCADDAVTDSGGKWCDFSSIRQGSGYEPCNMFKPSPPAISTLNLGSGAASQQQSQTR